MNPTSSFLFGPTISVAVLLFLGGCVGAPLSPVTQGPTRIRLARPTVVQAAMLGTGMATLPLGDYTAIGQNEKGVFFTAPAEILISLNTSEFMIAQPYTGGVAPTIETFRFKGGVCVAPAPPQDRSIVQSSLIWTTNEPTVRIPQRIWRMSPPVSFSVAK